jgi:hypothetical protein
MSANGKAHPVVYDGALVAIVGPDSCSLLAADLDPAVVRFALTMCLYQREVDAGRVPGQYDNERAARWARLVLFRDSGERLRGSSRDVDIAEQIGLPVDQVARARREFTADMPVEHRT